MELIQLEIGLLYSTCIFDQAKCESYTLFSVLDGNV